MMMMSRRPARSIHLLPAPTSSNGSDAWWRAARVTPPRCGGCGGGAARFANSHSAVAHDVHAERRRRHRGGGGGGERGVRLVARASQRATSPSSARASRGGR
jgi:hypothetical protein